MTVDDTVTPDVLATALVAALSEPIQRALDDNLARSVDAAVMAAARPYLRKAAREHGFVALGDLREKSYAFCFTARDTQTEHIIAATDGTTLSADGKSIETPVFETCVGFVSIIDAIAKYATELETALTKGDVAEAVRKIRSTMSRRGAATARIQCPTTGILIEAIVKPGGDE